MQKLARQPKPAGRIRRPRTGVAADRDGRSRPGARGSDACGRSPAGRAAAWCAGAPRSISKWVTRLARACRCAVDMRPCGRRGRGPIGASIVPLRASGRPSTSARYSRRISRRRISSWSARWTASDLATTSSPEVSRSRRWTMPGAPRAPSPPRRGPRAPGRACPSRWPGAGWTTTPGGLVHHQQVVVLEHDLEGHALAGVPRVLGGPAPRCAPRTCSPAASRWRFGRGSPSTVTRPRRSAAAPPRASRPPPRRQRTSRRAPASLRGRDVRSTRSVVACALSITYSRPSIPSTIAMSATLNAGQSDGSMKSVTAPSRGRGRAGCRARRRRSMPTGSHSHGGRASAREVDEQRAERRERERRPPARRRPPSTPNATPLLRTLVMSSAEEDVDRARRARSSCDHDLLRQPGRAPRRPATAAVRPARSAGRALAVSSAALIRPHDDRRRRCSTITPPSG